MPESSRMLLMQREEIKNQVALLKTSNLGIMAMRRLLPVMDQCRSEFDRFDKEACVNLLAMGLLDTSETVSELIRDGVGLTDAKAEITEDDLAAAADQLMRSERGQQAMRGLLDFLNDVAIGLDERNQEAVATLLYGAWGAYAGTARYVMHDRLPEPVES